MTQEPQQPTTNPASLADRQNPPSGEGWWKEEFKKTFFLMFADVGNGITDNHKYIQRKVKSFISHVASVEYERGKREERCMEKELITIGFDKNGEADFGIRGDLADLTIEQLNELRAMIPVAIYVAEDTWRSGNQSPTNKECSSEQLKLKE